MAIPRIIHQTAPSFDALRPDLKDNVARLRSLNPGWDYRFYDNAALGDRLRRSLAPEHLELARRVNPRYSVVLADLFRYLTIFREGGVYLDIKSGLDRPLDAMLEPDDRFLLSQWRNRAGEPFPDWGLHPDLDHIPGGEFQQWHLAGEPGHPFMQAVLERALANMARYDPQRDGVGFRGVLRLTGPICYTLAIAPLLGEAPHRIVDSAALGLRYSIYPLIEHRSHSPGHYSTLTEPIMLPPGL